MITSKDKNTKNPILILENIRSAYNTGVILRTCDALWWKAILSWFTPSPETDEKVKKTALGAHEQVVFWLFRNPKEALVYLRQEWYLLLAAEKNNESVSLLEVELNRSLPYALVMGNENTGVLEETLQQVDKIIHIPMLWIKESLNVAEAAAILMWELSMKQ